MTRNESQDRDENVKIVECNRRGGEVIIEKMRKISLQVQSSWNSSSKA